jgi:hypothetical protein
MVLIIEQHTWKRKCPDQWVKQCWQVKVKLSLYRPWGFQEVEAPRFQDNRHMKVVRLSALCTSHPYPQEIFLVLISVRWLGQPQDHSAAWMIMSIKVLSSTYNKIQCLFFSHNTVLTVTNKIFRSSSHFTWIWVRLISKAVYQLCIPFCTPKKDKLEASTL